jgi:hypothetical protein
MRHPVTSPTTRSTQSPIKRVIERLRAPLLAGVCLAAFAATPCRADPPDPKVNDSSKGGWTQWLGKLFSAVDPREPKGKDPGQNGNKGGGIIGIGESGLTKSRRKIGYSWQAGAVAADPVSCARAALAALRRNPGLYRGKRDGHVVWAQSDITAVLAWCVPDESGTGAILFAIAAGPDKVETERFVRLWQEARDLNGAPATRDGFENPRRRTPGAEPGEQALTFIWGSATRNDSSQAACEQAARAEAKEQLVELWSYPGLVSGSSPNGRAFVVCFGGGDGTRVWFATFGVSDEEVRRLNARVRNETMSRLDTAIPLGREAKPIRIEREVTIDPDVNKKRFP